MWDGRWGERIFRIDITPHHLRELCFEQRQFEWREVVDKILSMQMIDLVLDDARDDLVGFHLHFLEIAVEKFYADLLRTNDLFTNTRQTETAFFENRFPVRTDQDR